MGNTFYVYRFLDNKDNLLYIGRTNDINRRILKEHFTSLGHLPLECYKSIEKIQYVKFENESEEVAYEAILINKLRPKYNYQFKDNGHFNIKLPEIQWIDFELPYEHYLDYLKNRKSKTQNIKNFIINQTEAINFDNDSIGTGFIEIDKVIPIRDTDFILLAGDTSMGKTAYLLSVCNFVATQLNKKILYVNLKEDANSLVEKLISNKSRIPLGVVRKKTLTKEEIDRYASAVSELAESDIQFTNLTYENKTINKIISVMKSDSYDLIIIDDLQSIVNDKEIYIKDKTLEIMQKLNSFIIDTKTPLILTTGLSSDKIMSRIDHRPGLSDLEYDSLRTFPDIIKFLYRDEFYNINTDKKNIVEVIIDKNPLCVKHVTELMFLKEFYIMANIGKS